MSLREANELLSQAIDGLTEGKGFRGKIRGGVPIGEYRFKITPDNPKDIGFIVRSVEARKGKLKIDKKTKKHVIVAGDAFSLTGFIKSIQRLPAGWEFNGTFEQL